MIVKMDTTDGDMRKQCTLLRYCEIPKLTAQKHNYRTAILQI